MALLLGMPRCPRMLHCSHLFLKTDLFSRKSRSRGPPAPPFALGLPSQSLRDLIFRGLVSGLSAWFLPAGSSPLVEAGGGGRRSVCGSARGWLRAAGAPAERLLRALLERASASARWIPCGLGRRWVPVLPPAPLLAGRAGVNGAPVQTPSRLCRPPTGLVPTVFRTNHGKQTPSLVGPPASPGEPRRAGAGVRPGVRVGDWELRAVQFGHVVHVACLCFVFAGFFSSYSRAD